MMGAVDHLIRIAIAIAIMFSVGAAFGGLLRGGLGGML